VSVGGSLARAALGAFQRAATELREHGTFAYAGAAIGGKQLNELFLQRRWSGESLATLYSLFPSTYKDARWLKKLRYDPCLGRIFPPGRCFGMATTPSMVAKAKPRCHSKSPT